MSLFDDIERTHVGAANIIYRLDWCAPTEYILNTANCLPFRHTYCQRLLFLAHNRFHATPTPLHDLLVERETSYILTE